MVEEQKTVQPTKPKARKKVAVVGAEKGESLQVLQSKVFPGLKQPIKQRVLTVPNKKLTTKCKPVKDITSDILALACDMENLLNDPPPDSLRPIGVAASQLGECVRMFTGMLNPSAGKDNDFQIITLVNPELVYERKFKLVVESCMSLPKRSYKLKRGNIVKIRGTLLTGQRRSFKAHGLVAQMFMHELNHLDGILLDEIGERQL